MALRKSTRAAERRAAILAQIENLRIDNTIAFPNAIRVSGGVNSEYTTSDFIIKSKHKNKNIKVTIYQPDHNGNRQIGVFLSGKNDNGNSTELLFGDTDTPEDSDLAIIMGNSVERSSDNYGVECKVTQRDFNAGDTVNCNGLQFLVEEQTIGVAARHLQIAICVFAELKPQISATLAVIRKNRKEYALRRIAAKKVQRQINLYESQDAWYRLPTASGNYLVFNLGAAHQRAYYESPQGEFLDDREDAFREVSWALSDWDKPQQPEKWEGTEYHQCGELETAAYILWGDVRGCESGKLDALKQFACSEQDYNEFMAAYESTPCEMTRAKLGCRVELSKMDDYYRGYINRVEKVVATLPDLMPIWGDKPEVVSYTVTAPLFFSEHLLQAVETIKTYGVKCATTASTEEITLTVTGMQKSINMGAKAAYIKFYNLECRKSDEGADMLHLSQDMSEEEREQEELILLSELQIKLQAAQEWVYSQLIK